MGQRGGLDGVDFAEATKRAAEAIENSFISYRQTEKAKLRGPSAITRASRSSASRIIIIPCRYRNLISESRELGTDLNSQMMKYIPSAGVGEHLPALVSGLPPSSASQESGLGLGFYSFGEPTA